MARRRAGAAGGTTRLSLQLILLIISFFLIFIGKIDLYTVRATKSTISEMVAPIYDVVAAPVRAIETMASGMRTCLFSCGNVRLRAENERLKRWQRRAEILESENRQLKTAWGGCYNGFIAYYSACYFSPRCSFAHSLLLEIDDSRCLQEVMRWLMLMGLLASHRGWTQICARSFDLRCELKIPVLLSSSSWPGLALGQNTKTLRLDFLPLEARPEVGELVLTSGHGGILPPGVPVGRVISVDSETVVIAPSVALEQISFVSILTRDQQNVVDFNYNDLESFFAPLPPNHLDACLKGKCCGIIAMNYQIYFQKASLKSYTLCKIVVAVCLFGVLLIEGALASLDVFLYATPFISFAIFYILTLFYPIALPLFSVFFITVLSDVFFTSLQHSQTFAILVSLFIRRLMSFPEQKDFLKSGKALLWGWSLWS